MPDENSTIQLAYCLSPSFFFFLKKYKILSSNHIYKQEYIQHLLSWLRPDVSSIYYQVVLKNQVIFFFFIFLYLPNFLG